MSDIPGILGPSIYTVRVALGFDHQEDFPHDTGIYFFSVFQYWVGICYSQSFYIFITLTVRRSGYCDSTNEMHFCRLHSSQLFVYVQYLDPYKAKEMAELTFVAAFP